MKFITDYFRLILFCSGLLMGIQIPAVVDQYQKRVDAHLVEAKELIAGFQQTADKYFNGDMSALVAHYEKSDDVIFRDDAKNIRFMSDRLNLLKAELAALQQSSIFRTSHVLLTPDSKILKETMQQYSYVILINPVALVWGLVSGFLVAALLDVIFGMLGYVFVGRKKVA
ncbi:DUF2937 family protein [Paraglaciecola aquimarina]|uniref:DUF2937 family protein n=1 Tax=Paraglaciecola algarum TaxID=3050085 RepID=A0ABS9DAU3_9ALTE|nr:DUF2937 family protein [Paraglaciecola sp. G1-23]MCF2949500.1 DUF2937 family protein [Paraglaciecola sp. G1-23]